MAANDPDMVRTPPIDTRQSVRLTLRARLMLLVVASLVPLFAFTLGSQYLGYGAERAKAEQRTLEVARSMSLALERELDARIAGLQGLGLSRALRAGDLEAFRPQAEQFAAQFSPGSFLFVAEHSGQLLLDTRMPPGQLLPLSNNRSTLQRIFETGLPAVSGLFSNAITGSPTVTIAVPVLRDGQVLYSLGLSLPLSRFSDLIANERPSPGWVVSIFDQNGVNVARTPNPEQFVGQKASPLLLPHLLAEREGITETTSLEGIPLISVWTRAEPSSWSVAIGVPRAELSAPASRAAQRTFALGLAALLIGLALARTAARGVTQPIAALRRIAERSDTPIDPALIPTGLPETDQVAQALQAAGQARRRAEAEAQRSEDRGRLAIEAAELGTWHWDLITGDLVWSERCKAMFGLPPDASMTYGRFLSALHPDDRAPIDAAVQAALEQDGYDAEMRTLWSDETVHWVRAKGRAHRDEVSGQVIWMQGVVISIDRQKQIEAALAQSEERLQLAREAAGFGIWDWNIATTEMIWSDEQWRLFGLEPESTASYQTWRSGVHEEDRERVESAIIASVADPAQPFNSDYRVVWPDGSIHWVLSRAKVSRTAQGKAVRMVGITMDITARREAEAELQQLTRTLEQRVRDEVAAREAVQKQLMHAERLQALGQLAGGIAHDMNNVLQAVTSGASLIEKPASDAENVRRLAR
ncbi:MAG: PAS domain-containing protein, partial [Acetobacteraceae bacterium]|nr:PAS domain-containing protein [Acetobacteraceae bacterium]